MPEAGFFSLSSIALWGMVGALTLGILGFFLSLFLFVQNLRLKRELRILFSGKQAQDLEEVLLAQKGDIAELDREIQELYDVSTRLYQLSQESIHKTEILRFNPFKEVGGNHSFAVAFLNGRSSGFVISSLHTREGTRMYAKPVVNGAETKDFPLTEEEKLTVTAAAKKHTDIFTGTNHPQ
jgi:hypothetical protein